MGPITLGLDSPIPGGFRAPTGKKTFSDGSRWLKRPQIVSKDTQFNINLGIKWRGTLTGENGVGEVV